MYLKSEFKRRIVRLRNVIDSILVDDGNLNSNLYGFFPCLWSVFSLVWSHKCDTTCFLKPFGVDLVTEFTWPEDDDKFLPFDDVEEDVHEVHSSPYPDDVPFPFDAKKYGK